MLYEWLDVDGALRPRRVLPTTAARPSTAPSTRPSASPPSVFLPHRRKSGHRRSPSSTASACT
ncbi:MAG: hypothetical protein MZW92_09730 [Comamonadaceae bacterium]|nr:hypothetical protein [Comamonadaceae bacterium]